MSRQTLIQTHVNHQRRKRKRSSQEEEKVVAIAEEGNEGLIMKVRLCGGHGVYNR